MKSIATFPDRSLSPKGRNHLISEREILGLRPQGTPICSCPDRDAAGCINGQRRSLVSCVKGVFLLLGMMAACFSVFAASPPVKIFILAGQSNMEGQGFIAADEKRNEGRGSLEFLTKDPGTAARFRHLVGADGQWVERDDVWIAYLDRSGPLKPGYGARPDRIGPELSFGCVVGDTLTEPVLLIKCAWGGKSLAIDFRPPSAGKPPYSLGAKGDESLAKDPAMVGKYYRETIALTKAALARVKELVPGSDGRYELAGFGWHQGWNDRISDPFNAEYATNLAHFIRDVRRDLDAPRLPFVIAETGMTGPEEKHPRALSLMKAQASVAELPEFTGTVAFVPTREFWRPQGTSPNGQGYHWNCNAETYYLIGEAMGRVMNELRSVKSAAEKRPGTATAPRRPRLQIINGSGQPIDVFWLKSESERVANGSVAPGKDTVITTTLGHRFVIVGRNDRTERAVTCEVPVQAVRFDPPDADGIPAFYTQRVLAGGFPVVASARVNPYALKEAAWLIDLMLARRPDVRAAMVKSGARLSILAHDEFTTDQPEFARLGERPPREFSRISGKDFWDARARGMGGSERDPFCSCAEENLLGYPGDPYETENILIHEFAHNIHLRGLVNVDPTFDARLEAAYDAARKAGLWKGKYASVNHHEYFAEGVQSWFDNNRENDHDHNHVNTRAELIEYDPALAALCREVFGDTVLKYTKPVTRLTGHMAGYDPATAPRFEWPERLREAKRQIRRAAEERNRKADHQAGSGGAGTRPCRVITALIISRAGGPPALMMVANSRKNSGPMSPGVTTARALALTDYKLLNPWTAPRGK
jgi:hypothetical protein